MICIYNRGYVNTETPSTSVSAKKTKKKALFWKWREIKSPYTRTYVAPFCYKKR